MCLCKIPVYEIGCSLEGYMILFMILIQLWEREAVVKMWLIWMEKDKARSWKKEEIMVLPHISL